MHENPKEMKLLPMSLGDEERRLMHLVPAAVITLLPRVKPMKRRVLSKEQLFSFILLLIVAQKDG